MELLVWNIFEIRSDADTLHGVKLRGRIRKFSIENHMVCLVENALDVENVVRFALISSDDLEPITRYVKTLIPSAKISQVLESVQNPVLSKLKVNILSRYS